MDVMWAIPDIPKSIRLVRAWFGWWRLCWSLCLRLAVVPEVCDVHNPQCLSYPGHNHSVSAPICSQRYQVFYKGWEELLLYRLDIIPVCDIITGLNIILLNLTFHQILVSIEHLQRVWHANMGGLLLRTPGPVLLWDLHVFLCRDQSLLNLSSCRTLNFEHPSVLLFCLTHVCIRKKERRKRFESVLWQKPLYQPKIQKWKWTQNATKFFDYTEIADWLGTGSWFN